MTTKQQAAAETRYPCPVCLGVKMEKLQLEAGTDVLVLDHCARCGGVWFEAGEVQRMRRCEAELLWREMVRREDPHTMQCHSCRAPMSRDDAKCGVCGWAVELDCPTCQQPMSVSHAEGMSLDYCKRCKGVWFDHHELAGLWKLEMNAAMQRRHRAGGVAADGGDLLLTALYLDPFMMYYGLSAGAHVAGAAAEGAMSLAGGSAGAISEVAGAAGEAASSVFEVIVDIISGIFG